MNVFIILTAVIASTCAQQAYIPINRQASAVHADGSYQYSYETANGIAAEESGIGGKVAEGSAAWTAPDGTPVTLTYTADENGFHAQGSHVPQTPEYVLRALEYIRTHPYNEEQALARQRQREQARHVALGPFEVPQQELATPGFARQH